MKTLLAFIKKNRFIRSDRGGALAELAILVPFLVVMVAAVTELGRLFQTYTALSKSTRAAARYLSVNAYDPNHIDFAKNVAVCGKTDCTDTEAVVPGLTTDNVVVDPEWADPAGGGGNPVRVTIYIQNYEFQPIFNLDALLGNNRFLTLPASGSTTMYYMWTDPAAHP
ncbi:MAG TPA: TadE/TadG family type IV pilus assembly protein [Pyrinomonadaceae bacterium]|jgi:Flp pilus assembly protein TadG